MDFLWIALMAVGFIMSCWWVLVRPDPTADALAESTKRRRNSTFDHLNPAHYARIGCPKCGAKHKSFPDRPIEPDQHRECYRCWYAFNTSNARMYLNDVHPKYQSSCLEQYSGLTREDFKFPQEHPHDND